jgi:hypothetical protein
MQVETIKSALSPPLAKPKMIVSDHGTELTSNAILGWTKDHVQPSPLGTRPNIEPDNTVADAVLDDRFGPAPGTGLRTPETRVPKRISLRLTSSSNYRPAFPRTPRGSHRVVRRPAALASVRH